MSKVECYQCGQMFEPDPAKVNAWAESGADFEPTDWECPDCYNYEPEPPDYDPPVDESWIECGACEGMGILPNGAYCHACGAEGGWGAMDTFEDVDGTAGR
jgi:hypothetical protein